MALSHYRQSAVKRDSDHRLSGLMPSGDANQMRILPVALYPAHAILAGKLICATYPEEGASNRNVSVQF
jgi:hypothetical protein